MAKKSNPEYEIQALFVNRVHLQHPGIMVFSDTAAHIGKTMVQQVRANKLSTGVKWPDVFVAQPTEKYHGLYLEFKAESPFKKDGVTLKKSDHVEPQAECLEKLAAKGYKTAFVWDVTQALNFVNDYLNEK